MATKKANMVLVRTYSAGVHFGVLKSRKGQEVVLGSARRLWYWKGANTLNEVALRGVSSESKVSEAVPEVTLTQAIEILPMQEASVASFAKQGWGK